jgi:TetR/AcrR family transcriptional repressor of mexJK operon
LNIANPTAARRPGRPKSEEKADAIREAASLLFMTEGMERTSMDAISQAAGVSKQTVYSHFKSKDDLFRACVASKVQLYGLDESQLDVEAPVDAALQRVGIQLLTLLSDPDVIRMFRLMIAEATGFPKLVRSFHETGPRATVEYVARIFANYLQVETGDPLADEAARDFLALVKNEFFMEQLLGTRSAIDDKEMTTHVARCVTQIRKLYPL